MNVVSFNHPFKQKLDDFENLTNQLQSTLSSLHTDKKYLVAKKNFHKKAKVLVELTKQDQEVPSSLIKKMLTLHNIQVQQVDQIERNYFRHLSKLREIGNELKSNVGKFRAKKLVERYHHAVNDYLLISKNGEKFIENFCPDYDIIETILTITPLTKQEFLEVFPLNKNKPDKYNCTKDNFKSANEYIKKLPDKINGIDFIKFMSTDGFILSNQIVAAYYIETTYRKLKAAGFNWFGAFQEIIGKPITTYTIKQDEFGNVVSAELNKPKLTLVK